MNMTLKSVHTPLILLALVAALFSFAQFSVPVAAQTARDESCKVALNDEDAVYEEGVGCTVNGQEAPGLFDGPFKAIVNTLIFITGAISVLMLIIGGIRFAVSGGDANAIQGARNSMIYAIIGLIVALSAFGIVNFVLSNI